MVNQLEVPKLIETRIISGKGLFKVPYNEAYRYYWLYAQVIRLPVYNYNNYKWNPERSEYAKITWNNDGYVVREDVVKYQRQRFDWCVDPTGDAAFAITCYKSDLTAYLSYLAPFVGAPPLPPNLTQLVYFAPLKNYFDTILVSCRDDTGFSFSLYGLKYNRNCPAATTVPSQKPEAPVIISPITPPGVAIADVSPPYNPATNDDGNTAPFQGDENPFLPCTTVVRGSGLDVNTCGSLPNFGDYTFAGYGELRPITFGPNNCPALRLFIDGADKGSDQTYAPGSIILSRSGDCREPP